MEARDGLWPKGDPDCLWGNAWPEHYYPAQYTNALNYLQKERCDKERAFSQLLALVGKIEAEAGRGTPLQSNYGEWREGGYPQELLAAREYVVRKMERQERELLGDGCDSKA
jgi:hypothetical protein